MQYLLNTHYEQGIVFRDMRDFFKYLRHVLDLQWKLLEANKCSKSSGDITPIYEQARFQGTFEELWEEGVPPMVDRVDL